MTEIIPNFLYIGTKSDVSFSKYNVIINCASEIKQIKNTLKISISDDYSGSIVFGNLSILEEILEAINNALLNGQKVLVHCAHGLSRSPVVVIAYLMKFKHMNFEDAVTFVTNKNSKIDVHISLLRTLALTKFSSLEIK